MITVMVPGYGKGSYMVAAANTRNRVSELLLSQESSQDSLGPFVKIHNSDSNNLVGTDKFERGDWFLQKFKVWEDALASSNEQLFLHIDSDASITSKFSFERLLDELGDKSIGMVQQTRVLGDHPLEKQDLLKHYLAVSSHAVNSGARKPTEHQFKYFNTGVVLFRRRALENMLFWINKKLPILPREVNGNMVADQDLIQVYANEIAPDEIAELDWRWNHCEWWDRDFPNPEAAIIHMSNFCQGPVAAQMNRLALLSRGVDSQQFNDLTVLMVTHNSGKVLGDSIAALREIPGLQILIVDNGSIEPHNLNLDDRISVITNANNLGYARAVNMGLFEVKTDYVVLLNPDAFLTYEAVTEAMASLRQDPNQLLAPNYFHTDGQFLSALREGYPITRLVSDLFPNDRALIRKLATAIAGSSPGEDFLWLVGACVFSSRNFLLEIGGLDESYFLYMEDVELGRRARDKGAVRSLKYPILHLGSQSSQKSHVFTELQLVAARLQYLRRHFGFWRWFLLKGLLFVSGRPKYSRS